ncbi:MAG: hypothetical protein METHSR3v1_1950010 [Methanothrix sp.]|nr:MAG: hypothetical protein METHSR3v1_1950010 [Methanothrix sp.]
MHLLPEAEPTVYWHRTLGDIVNYSGLKTGTCN